MKKLLLLCLLLLSCSFDDGKSGKTSPSSSGNANNDYFNKKGLRYNAVPPACNLEKMWVFKIVCDMENNIFGVDQSFVEGVCDSEVELLNGMDERDAFYFLERRAAEFTNNRAAIKIHDDRWQVSDPRTVIIKALYNSDYTQEHWCILNNGATRIQVNVDVRPYCIGDYGKYDHNRCGVTVTNLRISNNGYLLKNISVPDDRAQPNIAYRLSSGFIYKAAWPDKKGSYSFTDYYSEDPTEREMYLRKDVTGFLDKYR